MLLLFFKSTGDTHDGGAESGEYLKKKRRKSPRQTVEAAIDKALRKAEIDRVYRPNKEPGIWQAESVPEFTPLEIPAFDPKLTALADPLAAIRADLARINEQARREEEDIELLLMSI